MRTGPKLALLLGACMGLAACLPPLPVTEDDDGEESAGDEASSDSSGSSGSTDSSGSTSGSTSETTMEDDATADESETDTGGDEGVPMVGSGDFLIDAHEVRIPDYFDFLADPDNHPTSLPSPACDGK